MSELVVRTLELLAETKDGFVSAVKNIFNTRTMATLKISDLSIGDYVCYCDRVYKVYSIEESGLVRANNKSYSCPHIMKHIDYIDPIPITAEILEKNGFVKNGEYNEWNAGNWDDIPFIGISLSRQSMRIKNLGTDIFIENKVVYVHQLQRALSLANIDELLF